MGGALAKPAIVAVAATAFVLAAMLLWSWAGGERRAQAVGSGPDLAISGVAGTTLSLSASSSAADPYKGFNLHVHLQVGSSVTVTGVSGDSTGSVLPGTLFCPAIAIPAGLPGGRVFGCTIVGAGATQAAGLLATLTIETTGAGCIEASLVEDLASDTALLDSYTINAADNSQQSNVVDTSSVTLFAGGATEEQCVETEEPTPTESPSPGTEVTATEVTATTTTQPATTVVPTLRPNTVPRVPPPPTSVPTAAPREHEIILPHVGCDSCGAGVTSQRPSSSSPRTASGPGDQRRWRRFAVQREGEQ